MANIIDGKHIAAQLRQQLAQQVTRLGVVMGLNSQPTAKTEVKNSQLTEAEVVKSFSMF